jgi:hypothetical protein
VKLEAQQPQPPARLSSFVLFQHGYLLYALVDQEVADEDFFAYLAVTPPTRDRLLDWLPSDEYAGEHFNAAAHVAQEADEQGVTVSFVHDVDRVGGYVAISADGPMRLHVARNFPKGVGQA